MPSALTSLAVATTAALAAALLTTPTQASAPTRLQPEDLPRGADIRVAHIEDGDFVLGERHVDVGGDDAHLLGRAGRAWVVGTTGEDGQRPYRVVRVRADDSTKVIKRGVPFFESALSENGRFLVLPGRARRTGTPVCVFSTRSGKLKAERELRNHPQVLGMDGPRVLLSTWMTGVSSWHIRTGELTAIAGRPANIVDIRNDLLATYTKDPYRGGCVRLSRLSSPRTGLWKSCTERIAAFSPDGDRMATIDLLSDGIGPGQVWERESDGTLLGHYSTSWFGAIAFESDTALLLEINGDSLSSTARCSAGACANATDPTPVRRPRISPARRAGQSGSVAPAAGAWRMPRS